MPLTTAPRYLGIVARAVDGCVDVVVAERAEVVADEPADVVIAAERDVAECDVLNRAAVDVAEQADVVAGTGNREVADNFALPVESAFELIGTVADGREGDAAHVDIRRDFEGQAAAVVPAVDVGRQGLQVLRGGNFVVAARLVVSQSVDFFHVIHSVLYAKEITVKVSGIGE